MKPCYTCRDRHAACAGECERYADWIHGLRADKAARRRQEEEDKYLNKRDIWRHTV